MTGGRERERVDSARSRSQPPSVEPYRNNIVAILGEAHLRMTVASEAIWGGMRFSVPIGTEKRIEALGRLAAETR